MDLTDPVTFEQAYDQHHRAVYATALRVLRNPVAAQDVVQDVFLRLWRNPGSYDGRRGELGGYLRLMARSRAVDLWRERQVVDRATDRLTRVVAREDDVVRPDELVERRAERSVLTAALRRLPEEQREAVVLASWGGLTAGQIAARVGIPLGTAKSRIRLGLARLRELHPEMAEMAEIAA